MKKQSMVRILLAVSAAVCVGIFFVRLSSGASVITAGFWIAIGVVIGIIAAALKVNEEKAIPTLVGSTVTLILSLMIISFFLWRTTAPLSDSIEASTKGDENTVTSTITPEPTPSPLPYISWSEKYYVDEFNDPTDESYLSGRFIGSFSNSATSGAILYSYLIFDKVLSGQSSDFFRMKLFEYGDYIVNYNYIDKKDVNIKIKINGCVFEAHPDLLTENEIYIKRNSPLFSQIIDALTAGEKISVVVTESKYSTSTYRFTIDSYGLDEIDHNWKS